MDRHTDGLGVTINAAP